MTVPGIFRATRPRSLPPVALCALLLLPALTGVAIAAPSTEDVFRDPLFGEAKIPPTGQFLAARVPREDQTVPVIIDLKKNEPVISIRRSAREHIHDFWWVGDERVVFNTVIQTGSFDRPRYTNDLYAVNSDGSKPWQLFGWGANDSTFPEVIDLLPDDPRHILLACREIERLVGIGNSRAQIFELDVRARSPRRLKDLGRSPLANGEVLADHRGVVRVATGIHELTGRPQLRYRSGRNSDWQNLSDLLGKQGEDVEIRPLGFSGDSEKVYILRRAIDSTASLQLLDPETREIQEIFRDQRFDLEERQIVWSADDRMIVGTKYVGDLLDPQCLLPEHPDTLLNTALDAALPGQRVKVTSYTSDGLRALVYVWSDRDPGSYYLFDREKRELAFLFKTRPWIDPAEMAERRAILVPARDGLELHGFLTLPVGVAEAGLPMIVIPHGGPHGVRDRQGFSRLAQFLASRGFAVLQINFRGSGGYGRPFEEAGFRQWGRTMQDDVTDATRWVVEQGIADPARICIFGASYGGYAALMGVIRQPTLYRCAIGYVGVYDLALMHTRGDIPHYFGSAAYLERALGTDPADLKARSPLHNVEQIRVPVFLVHGGKDARVPVVHFHRMRKALKERGVELETLLEPLEGHGFYKLEHNVALMDRVVAFVEKHTQVLPEP